MKLVFILTETGAAYGEEGILFVSKEINATYGETDELTFMMGDELNDVKTLIALLDDHIEDGYVAISRSDGIMYMPPGEGIWALSGILKEYGGDNSWTTINAVINDGVRKRQEKDPDFKICETK